MLNVEAWLKVTLQHARSIGLQTEAASCTSLQKTNHLLQIQASFVTVDERFTEPDHRSCNHDLVRHFGVLTLAKTTHIHDLLRVGLQQGHAVVDSLRLTANHGHQLAILRSNISTGNRCIQALDSKWLEVRSDSLCQAWGASSVVDQVGVGLHGLEYALFRVINYIFQIFREAQH